MADSVFDINDMVELEKDKESLGKAVNGSDSEDVVTRLGAQYPTLKKAIKTIMQKAPINSTPFATKSALLADTTLADGEFAFVYNDDAHSNNGIYQKISGVWTYLKSNVKAEYSYEPSGKNLFDKSKVILGFEVYGDGRVIEQPQSVTSGLINVSGLSNVTISGLQDNPEMFRYFKFSDADNAVIVVYDKTGNTVSLVVPSNAKYLQFSVQQRTTTAFDGGSTVQVESGATATIYEPYKQAITAINGVGIKSTALSSDEWANKNFVLFGDSITQTANVDAGDYTSLTFRSNWFVFAKDMLQVKDFRNFAKSGASYMEYTGQETWQKISHQVATAISTGFIPDIVVIACGTNDGLIKLGDYDTAMSKAISALDMSITADAMRKNLYEISKAYPNAKLFSCLPLQRADDETSTRQPLYDLIRKMSGRYGFTVIDCHNESGIVKDFEIWQQQGRDLYDGLHPAQSGQVKQARLITAKIKANYQI